jgi:AhpD family alkylhydroperoxidase
MMTARIHWLKDQAASKAIMAIGEYVHNSGLELSLIDLVLIRVSQINHCAFCLDMHTKDARAIGETEQRIYGLNAWEDAPYYSERERAALVWAEAVTLLTEGFVPDAVFEQAHAQFSDDEMIQLTMVVVTINTWNRMNVSFRIPAGDYQSRRKPAAQASAAQVG